LTIPTGADDEETPVLHDLTDLNILRYITFRAAMAAVTAFAIGIAAGPYTIAWLRRKKIGEQVEKGDSVALDELHRSKKHTPTMGGILIVAATVISTLLFARLDAFFVQLGLFAMIALGALGFVDDRAKLVTKGKGTSARTKLRVQAAIGLLIGLALYAHYQTTDGVVEAAAFVFGEDEAAAKALTPRMMVQGDALYFPFAKATSIGLGLGYAVFAALVVVATCNAVNLSDGLDGLAAGCSSMVILVYVVIAYVVGRVDFSSHLAMPFVPGAGEAAVFGAAALGATLAFLWFNAHPAEVFMGDTGSLALGATIAVLALSVKQELLLPLAGGVFVAEAGSVLLQVGSFKLTGKRIFRIAPLHHHFQFGGLFETKVTMRLWIVGAILATLALATLKVR
jgi:phospho-N-acetylmuramoyl-pentapeptide-transferase